MKFVLFIVLIVGVVTAAPAYNSTITLFAKPADISKGVTVNIVSDLGPVAVLVNYDTPTYTFEVRYFGPTNASISQVANAQPTQITVNGNTLSLSLSGQSDLADTLGQTCKVEPFSLQSPRPPCVNWGFSPSSSRGSKTSFTSGASIVVTVSQSTTVCVNGFCANALYYTIPELSPQGFRNIGSDVVYDSLQGVMWHKYHLTDLYPYDDNFTSINKANLACQKSRNGGYSDWRLPTRSELHLMTDDTSNPAQNLNFFPENSATGTWSNVSAYWTTIRTRVQDYYGIYFFIYGGDGGITYSDDVGYTKVQRARCVRTVINKLPNRDRFFTSGSGLSATDKNSGLVWQVTPPTTVYEANKGATPAINYCENLDLDGRTDWRLPNNKEMASFMDESRAGPAWNITIFPKDDTSNMFWWNSNYNVHFGNGKSNWWAWSGSDGCSYVNVSPARARCVRGPYNATSSASTNSGASTNAGTSSAGATDAGATNAGTTNAGATNAGTNAGGASSITGTGSQNSSASLLHCSIFVAICGIFMLI